MFGWLAEEIASVRTNKYFVVGGVASDELRQAILSDDSGLPRSYKTFVLQFGTAKLYRETGGYALGVKAGPVPAETAAGEALLGVGHFQGRRAFFKVSLLRKNEEPPVFESGAGGFVRVADSFEDWLRQRASAVRKKLGKRRWAQIVRGPKPFTAEEQAIVQARKRFLWKAIGVAPNGDIEIEVTNDSDRRLPFYSLGVRSEDRTVNGATWIPTCELAPSQAKRFERDCYKKQIPRDDVYLFTLPDPGPEDREAYWEFK